MVSGRMKCVKYLLFGFNLIFLLAAIGLIAVGAYVQITLNNYSIELSAFSSSAALLVAVGVLIFFIAFFGCCGAIKENRICVLVFATLLVIIFILEISGAIAGFVYKGKTKKFAKDLMEKNFEKNMNFWDVTQTEFKCCGIDGPDDWSNRSQDIPNSCCNDQKSCNNKSKNNLHSEGCLAKFVEWLRNRIGYVACVALGFAFIQVVGILFACCLANAIKKEYEII